VAATLEKHLNLRLSDHDLYINVAGGMRIAEVGAELALAMAIYSARTGLALPRGTAVAGELSLAGELRPIRRMAARIKAARSLGFERFLGPNDPSDQGDTKSAPRDPVFTSVGDLKSAVQALFK
jgi:DNA repair protein RadA/Sms